MLKPEIIELIVLVVFGPAIGVFLCLRTTVGDWLTELAARPFEFLDDLVSDQPQPAYSKTSGRLEKAT